MLANQIAPPTPTTAELHEAYEWTAQDAMRVAEMRARVSDILSGRRPGLVAAAGACSLSDEIEPTTLAEAQTKGDLNRSTDSSLVILDRECPWKPRSIQTGWFGQETTNPRLAYQTIHDLARAHGNVASEWAKDYHPDRYEPYTTLAWFGARTDDPDLLMQIARENPSLPLGVKNGLDGEIDDTLQLIEELRAQRKPDEAPVVLIYRGGDNAQTSDAWAREYERALERTNGLMIVDTAHGGEQAHHPNGNFKEKTVEGQVECLDNVVRLAREGDGHYPRGIMIEACGERGETDIPMPLDVALRGIMELHKIIRAA